MSEEYEQEPELLSTVQELLKFNPAVDGTAVNGTAVDRTPEFTKRIHAWKRMEIKFRSAGLLKGYQRMRRLRQLPSDVLFFLVARTLMSLVDEIGQPPELRRVDDRIQEIERAHGLGEGEEWLIDEGPPEWQLAQDEWDALTNAFEVKVMRDHGEEKLAALYLSNPDEYEACYDRGRRAVYGSSSRPPEA